MKEKNILLIDDDELTHKNFQRIFEYTKYKLDSAIDSIEGLSKIKKNHYDLILLDIIMPDLNNRKSQTAGIELLKVIRKLKQNLPIIMITVINEVETAVDTLKLGARDYITKDRITSEELIRRVDEALISAHNPIEEIISRGESPKLEFKSSMRWNFNAKKIDKEIELAWLKTIAAFMNTEGGTLLIGVKDDGTILGIEADNFPNEDKFLLRFSNLINQYIGPEFSKFIKYELIPFEGKKVLLVKCEKSKKPVLMKKNKDEEEFYIRVGPSTRKLSMSEMLKYLEGL
jgi:DNA-binding response OmpR family regulator